MLNNDLAKRLITGVKRRIKPIIFSNQYLLYTYGKLKTGKEREMELLPQLLKSNAGVAIDIGANVGVYTKLLLRECGSSQVHVFEPQPGLCQYIKGQTKNFSGVTIYNMGLGDCESELELHIPLANGTPITGQATFQILEGMTYESITVPVKTLDSFMFENIAFIKIDVEGFESKVLAGAKETIRKSKPIMLIEIEQRHLNRDTADGERPLTTEDVIKQVEDMGYRCYCYIEKKLVPFKTISSTVRHVQEEKIEGKQVQNYIFNFFFFPLEKSMPV